MPARLPAVGPKRATVALFTGCVADAVYPETNVATAKVLQPAVAGSGSGAVDAAAR